MIQIPYGSPEFYNSWLTVASVGIAAVSIGVAIYQTTIAKRQEKYAKAQATIAEEQRKIAENEAVNAANQRNIADAERENAANARALLEVEKQEVRGLQKRHELVSRRVSRVNVKASIPNDNGTAYLSVYKTVFPTVDLRDRIETYLVEPVDNGTRFTVRKPTEFELRSLVLRKTVDDVESILESLKVTDHKLAEVFYDKLEN